MNFSKKPQKEINDNETWLWKRNVNTGICNVRSLFWSGALIVLNLLAPELFFLISAHPVYKM